MKTLASHSLLIAVVFLAACQPESSEPAVVDSSPIEQPQWQRPQPATMASALPAPAIEQSDACQPRETFNSVNPESKNFQHFANQAFHGMVAIDEAHGVALESMYSKDVLVVNMVTGDIVADHRIKDVRTARSFTYNICHDAIYLPSIVGSKRPTVGIIRLSLKDGSQDRLELPDIKPTETPTSPVIFNQSTGTGYFSATSRKNVHELYSMKTDLTLINHGEIQGVPYSYNEKHHSILTVVTGADGDKSLNYYKLMDDGQLALVKQGPVIGKRVLDVAIVGHGYNVITATSDSAAAYSPGSHMLQEFALSDLSVKTGAYETGDEIVDIARTSDGQLISSADRRQVRVFNTTTKEKLFDKRVSCDTGSNSRIQDVSFSRDGKKLFVVMHCGIGAKLNTEIFSQPIG